MRTPNYSTALLAGAKRTFYGVTVAVVVLGDNDTIIYMPYKPLTLDQHEKLQDHERLTGIRTVILDAKAWAITPKVLQEYKAEVLKLIETGEVFAVRLHQEGYETTEATIYTAPMRKHTEVLNRKARMWARIFNKIAHAERWAREQGARIIKHETLL